jgi:hypothetical protein
VHSANKDPRTGVEYRGTKGTLYEGGLRVPFVARWPGRIEAGSVSDHLGYFPDMLPTIAEVTGARAPADIDGISILPTLIGAEAAGHAQKEHDFLYWEIGGATAIRQGNWRAVRPKPAAPWELYDLATDPSESKDVAAANPEVVERLARLAAGSHEPAVEGTFRRTDRHERDRRAKTGQQDNPDAPDPLTGARPQAKTAAMPTKGMLSNKGWTIARASSENAANGKLARNAIDGDPTTLWHSRFTEPAARPPHELVIDLGAEHTVRGFVYLGRQDAGWNGAIREVEFCVGSAPDRVGDPVVRAELARTKEPQTVACPPTRGRFILLRARTEHGGKRMFATVAELGVLGE